MTPQPMHHVPYITFCVCVCGGAPVSSLPSPPKHVPPSPFILDLLPFPETLHRNTCRGLNSVHCFQSSLPHLASCGVGPVAVWASATGILLRCYHSTSATETWRWHVKNIWQIAKSNRGQGNVHRGAGLQHTAGRLHFLTPICIFEMEKFNLHRQM